MPKNLGQEHAARTAAERSGGLDGYLDSVGAGDDLDLQAQAARAQHDALREQRDLIGNATKQTPFPDTGDDAFLDAVEESARGTIAGQTPGRAPRW